ncbi:PQQ-dependent sugar dehydrogenase [Saccharothrix isguenensis]
MPRLGADGSAPTGNPFYANGGNALDVWTYGHRDVQGVASPLPGRLRPAARRRTRAGRQPPADDQRQ